jgi:hypothetical protein
MTTIKLASTRNGWAIALLAGTNRTGTTYYDVVRVAPNNKYVTLHSVSDRDKARTLANREWAADKTGSYPAR